MAGFTFHTSRWLLNPSRRPDRLAERAVRPCLQTWDAAPSNWFRCGTRKRMWPVPALQRRTGHTVRRSIANMETGKMPGCIGSSQLRSIPPVGRHQGPTGSRDGVSELALGMFLRCGPPPCTADALAPDKTVDLSDLLDHHLWPNRNISSRLNGALLRFARLPPQLFRRLGDAGA